MDIFWYQGALELNKSRVEHLASLNLDFNNKHVFETGCGGQGDITKFLMSKNAIVTLNDVREINIKSTIEKLNTNFDFNTWDLNKDLPKDKVFDIIVCYGTLYHLNEPENAIRNMSQICKEFTIISTITNGSNDNNINLVNEDYKMLNQAGNGFGCRPGRGFIYNTLKKYFKYVYLVKTQPNNPEFPLKFPSHVGSRNIFIGSHIQLNNPLFVESLIDEFSH